MKTIEPTLSLQIFKNVALILFSTLMLGGLNSCKKDCFPIKASGSNLSKNYSVPYFSGIELSINANVILQQDSIQSLVVEAPENIQERLSFIVSGGILNIGYKENCGAVSGGEIKVYATAAQIQSLNISGSGKVTSSNVLKTPSLNLRISGSGEINITSETQSTLANISGSGKMNLFGTTNFEDLKISGSGDFHAYGLNSINSTIKISGSGNAEVSVSNNLNVEISGSGDVFYKGNPIVNSSISGSGKLKNTN